jgi:hypothetical protein
MTFRRLPLVLFATLLCGAQSLAATVSYSVLTYAGGEGPEAGGNGYYFLEFYEFPRFNPGLGDLTGATFWFRDAFVRVEYGMGQTSSEDYFAWNYFSAGVGGSAQLGQGDGAPGIGVSTSRSGIVPLTIIPPGVFMTFSAQFPFAPIAVRDESDLSDLIGNDSYPFALVGQARSYLVFSSGLGDTGYHLVDWRGRLGVTYEYTPAPEPPTGWLVLLCLSGVGLTGWRRLQRGPTSP